MRHVLVFLLLATTCAWAQPDPGQEFARRWALVNLAAAAENPTALLALAPRMAEHIEEHFTEPNEDTLGVLLLLEVIQLEALQQLEQSSRVLEQGPPLLEKAAVKPIKPKVRKEIELRTLLALGQAARRAWQIEAEEKYLNLALDKAENDTVGALARFVASTFLFDLEGDLHGNPSDAQAIARCEELMELLHTVPLTVAVNAEGAGLWRPTADACRFWIYELGERAAYLEPEDPVNARLNELSLQFDIWLGGRFLDLTEEQLLEAEALIPGLSWVADGRVRHALGLYRLPTSAFYGSLVAKLDRVVLYRNNGELERARRVLKDCDFLVEQSETFAGTFQLPVTSLEPGLDLMPGSAAARLRARYFEELGVVEFHSKNYAEAAAALGQAIARFETAGDLLAVLRNSPQHAQAVALSGDSEEGLALAGRAVERARALGHEAGLVAAFFYRAEIHLLREDREAAIADLKSGIGILEKSWAVTGVGVTDRMLRYSQYAYDLLARLEIEAGRTEEAFSTVTARSQVKPSLVPAVLKQAGRTRSLEIERLDAERLPDSREKQTRKAAVRQRLAETRADFLKQTRELRGQHGQTTGIRPVEYARLQKELPPGVAVVQYFVPDDTTLYIFVATHERLTLDRVETEPGTLDGLITSARRSLTDRQPGAEERYRREAAALYELLLKPIEADIEGNEVLAILPMGRLFYLPFQGLGRNTDGGFRYLIEDYQLVTLAQANDLFSGEPAHRAGGSLLAIGDPDGTLPGAGKEASRVADLFTLSQLLTGGEATLERIIALLHSPTYLHLATHGRLDARAPNRSYLVLTGDQRLDIDHILAMDLAETRLVTLSACDTSVGQRDPGTEVSSLAEAFWLAGAPAVVASLWQVDDEATGLLMVAFYKHLAAGESRARALQLAQLELLKNKRTSPAYYWAGFVLWGDWR